jgi:hypothetical protein
LKSLTFLEKVCKWARKQRERRDQMTVVPYESYESTNVCDTSGSRKKADRFLTLIESSYQAVRDLETKCIDQRKEKRGFLTVQLESILITLL